ncbi:MULTISPECIES: hypothetical protein [Streptomyces]|uniref:hypothetical protein n=1 Tax=Streptomyces TaxID=1883 RepID=UPI0002F18A50|nr:MULTISPECIES: hypothetical protein [Streptomyces]MDW8475204.1 hypothetical protein [Streptomyces scabiei]MDX2535941.1 hypothetical protein [Streptomyces scabiei]MDX2568465.1 hypothetical protein [Streptomyces scabiei]MDX2581337.1 hypothetical protein [Streptomyces scabiei]MDX2627405.1 hypothetical protein [Streptomyces scabiei]
MGAGAGARTEVTALTRTTTVLLTAVPKMVMDETAVAKPIVAKPIVTSKVVTMATAT